jgi:hypothetical protein
MCSYCKIQALVDYDSSFYPLYLGIDESFKQQEHSSPVVEFRPLHDGNLTRMILPKPLKRLFIPDVNDYRIRDSRPFFPCLIPVCSITATAPEWSALRFRPVSWLSVHENLHRGRADMLNMQHHHIGKRALSGASSAKGNDTFPFTWGQFSYVRHFSPFRRFQRE